MDLKHIFLALSIIVILSIFYKQYMTRQTRIETLTETNDVCSDSDLNDYTDSLNLPLREYCIKSSFNSAYNGTNVSADVLEARIKEGYRFIDLNVYSASGDVYVGFSQDNSPNKESPTVTLVQSNLLLSDALNKISSTAFSSTVQTDSSMSDFSSFPVFVHIRIYRSTTSTIDIIADVEKIINGVPDNQPAYSVHYLRHIDGKPIQISGCTPLKNIMGKMILSMDILNILEMYAPVDRQTASDVPMNDVKLIDSFVNVLTGGSTIPAFYRYTDETMISRTNKLGIGDDKLRKKFASNVNYMYISFPHPNDIQEDSNPKATGVIQPDIPTCILNRSIQLIPMRVYLGDDTDMNLTTYKTMFNTIGKPFAPMSSVYTYLNAAAPPRSKKNASEFNENNETTTSIEGASGGVAVLIVILVILLVFCIIQYYYFSSQLTFMRMALDAKNFKNGSNG